MDPTETTQEIRSVVADHRYSNELPKPKKICPICNKELPSNGNLSFHMMLHPSDKPFACDYCLHTFKTKQDLYKHCSEEHGSERSHCCETCGKVFCHSANLKRHQDQNHSNIRRYKCIYCDLLFKEYGQYRAHESGHDTVTDFQCSTCEVYFEKQISLDSHVQDGQCVDKILKCCKITFNSRNDYVQHTLDKHKKYKKAAQKCEFCGKTFPFPYFRRQHEELCGKFEGPARKNTDGKNTNYPCNHCDRTFSSYMGLAVHLRMHTEGTQDAKYSCPVCHKKLASYTSLYVHKARHLNIKRYFCELCNKGFFSRPMLKAHSVVHSTERPFKCRFCEKAFPRKSSLCAHERMHTGERPFSCNYCELRFMRYSAKQNHERRHTGEKPYTCSVCGKSFIQHSTWRQHERTHKDRLDCEFCGHEFLSRKDFKMHRRGGKCNTADLQKVPDVVEEVVASSEVWDQPTRMTRDNNGNIYLYYDVP